MIIFFRCKTRKSRLQKIREKKERKKGVNNYFQSNFYDQSIGAQIIISKMKSSGLEKLEKRLKRLKKA